MKNPRINESLIIGVDFAKRDDISDEKNSFAISVDDQIIQSVKKQFAKLGCITKQRKGLRIKPRLLFLC